MAESYLEWRVRIADAVEAFNDMDKAARSRYRDEFLYDQDFDVTDESLFWDMYNDSQS